MSNLKTRRNIIKLINKIWNNAPHLRFFQLLINVTRDEETMLFYMEDEHFEKLLNNFIDKYIGKENLKCKKRKNI